MQKCALCSLLDYAAVDECCHLMIRPTHQNKHLAIGNFLFLVDLEIAFPIPIQNHFKNSDKIRFVMLKSAKKIDCG